MRNGGLSSFYFGHVAAPCGSLSPMKTEYLALGLHPGTINMGQLSLTFFCCGLLISPWLIGLPRPRQKALGLRLYADRM